MGPDFLGLRLNVWTALILFVLAVAAFLLSAKKRPGQEDIATGPAAGKPTDDAATSESDEAVTAESDVPADAEVKDAVKDAVTDSGPGKPKAEANTANGSEPDGSRD